MNAQEIIEKGLKEINDRAKNARKCIRKLSPNFEYRDYSSGWAMVETYSPTFEDYLELSALLPINNELHGYDLYWKEEKDDSLIITHKIQGKDYNNTIYYRFVVGDVERTLEKLTEGKCKVVKKTEKEKERTYTALSCNI